VRRPWTWWLAWGLWGLFAALIVSTVVLDTETTTPGEVEESLLGDITLVIAFFAFATVGALVGSRQPRNAVGWLFLFIPTMAAVGAFSQQYATQAFADGGSLPGGMVAAWLALWTWYPAIGSLGFVMLLFPDGHVIGRRWRYVLWALLATIGALTASYAFYPGPVDADSTFMPDNPLGIQVLESPLNALQIALVPVLLALVLASAASMVVRFRRSQGDERQQLKWMTLAVLVVVCFGLAEDALGAPLGDEAFGITITLIPIAAGVAMLKYRLYDVDVVIRKTLVYGALSAVLAATYVGVVVGMQALLQPLTEGSDLAIAVSTLVVAALFLPLRSRVQRVVDRRFYRRRYDAQRTLEAFGAQVRREVELEELRVELCRVVAATVEPASTSVWLRGRGKAS
jgi:hypothetical protein